MRSFESYDELVDALEPIEAIKVATWWNTAASVWLASVLPRDPGRTSSRTSRRATTPTTSGMRDAVLASYRHEFRYMTISAWNRDRLRELGLDAELIPPGIDLANFRPLRTPTRAATT